MTTSPEFGWRLLAKEIPTVGIVRWNKRAANHSDYYKRKRWLF